MNFRWKQFFLKEWRQVFFSLSILPPENVGELELLLLFVLCAVMMMMMMSFLWPQSTPPHSARGQSQAIFRLDAVLEAKQRRKLGAVHRESGKWPQQPHFAKNKLLGAAGSEMFSAVSPPLSRFDELWQLHNNTWQQPGPLTQQEPLQSGFDPKDTGSQLVWSCGTAMEDSVYLICRCYRNLFSPECERQSSNTSYCVTYLLFTMEQSTYYVMKLGHV